MENAKSAQEIAHHTQERDELIKAGARPFEENLIGSLRRYSQGRTVRLGRSDNWFLLFFHRSSVTRSLYGRQACASDGGKEARGPVTW